MALKECHLLLEWLLYVKTRKKVKDELRFSLSLLSNSLSDSMSHSIFISLFLFHSPSLSVYLFVCIQVIVRKAKTDKTVEAGCGMCLTLRKTIKEERTRVEGENVEQSITLEIALDKVLLFLIRTSSCL